MNENNNKITNEWKWLNYFYYYYYSLEQKKRIKQIAIKNILNKYELPW